MKRLSYLFFLISLIGFTHCTKPQQTLFELITPDYSGVDFENTIIESDTFNVLTFEYIYNGGGVGIGDFNNDNLPDIFFAGNRISSRCYLNKGDFKFDDITSEALLSTNRWCTGVAVHDFNQDGWTDIYVCTVNTNAQKSSNNLLFINKGLNKDGIPVFQEMAEHAGIAAHAYSTQASFLDYDLDGDLDMYLVTNSLESYPKNNPVGQNDKGLGKSQDKLYRNDSDSLAIHFTDVSREAGILTEGWGLGIAVTDINMDGYPDVYVANDFLSNDHLYINNKNGTFTNKIKSYFTHTEFNGMGVDIADINNDGLNDVLSVDMYPDDNQRQKAMFSNIGYSKFKLNQRQKYLTQYARNVLQINNGNNTFSDIGCLSGIYDTDWSWSALLADFDNDGWRDILITNGYKKDITDMDFVTYSSSNGQFGRAEDKFSRMMSEVNKLKGVFKPNFVFKNNKDLTFSNETINWGLNQPSFSNGAAYADFDRDGDLDLVMNNINAPAFIYRNTIREKKQEGNYINVSLIGENKNKSAIGAKLYIYYKGGMQYSEYVAQRGFKSSVEPIMHFGLGDGKSVDSINIIWPSGKQQLIRDVAANQNLVCLEEDGYNLIDNAVPQKRRELFSNSQVQHSLKYVHHEEDFVDFKQSQASLLHKFSQSGPFITTGDVDANGLNDFIIGGSSGQYATIYLQQKDGSFRLKAIDSKLSEDEDILLFDADGDEDLDLICVSGSSEFGSSSKEYRHRLYSNDGSGSFKLNPDAFDGSVNSSGSCVEACDFDKDGDLDLFIGGRVVPNKYPTIPESFLLKNESKNSNARFSSVDIPEVKFAGMITGACWVDFDNDTWTDLVVVGEWMPVTFFKNYQGVLKKMPESSQLPMDIGWWRCIKSGDFDRDGDMDFVVGNFGLNSIYKASPKEPVTMYVKDFDGNGSIDPFVCRFIQGKEYPIHPRETMTEQMVSLRRVLTSYAKYGASSLSEIFSAEQLENMKVFKCNQLASSYIENLGNGNFKLKELSLGCQTSPINDLYLEDVNDDGNLDVIAIQNDYSFETLGGLYDAGIGLILIGDGKGNFYNATTAQTNFCVRGDARSIGKILTKEGRSLYLITQNSDSLIVYERNDLLSKK